jgi:UDP-N-acetylmuramoylalanine--D-glutamate ligase
MSLYKDKHIAIIGLSVEGVDSAKFLAQEGAILSFHDKRTKEELGNTYTLLEAFSDQFFLSEEYLHDLNTCDLIVRTPGMSLDTPELIAAKQAGAEITSLTKLFFQHCKAKIIGVTGTKGKGTTSTLIARILETNYDKVWLGGNVGTPLLSHVLEIKSSDVVVLELSSFQLEDLTQSPHVAVVLRITEDHLANFDPLASNFS